MNVRMSHVLTGTYTKRVDPASAKATENDDPIYTTVVCCWNMRLCPPSDSEEKKTVPIITVLE